MTIIVRVGEPFVENSIPPGLFLAFGTLPTVAPFASKIVAGWQGSAFLEVVVSALLPYPRSLFFISSQQSLISFVRIVVLLTPIIPKSLLKEKRGYDNFFLFREQIFLLLPFLGWERRGWRVFTY